LIYIIRHGKTELNKSNVLQGRSNYPLNNEGIKQAEEVAQILKDVTFT
jgi:broad specificity phosphatase PhoE